MTHDPSPVSRTSDNQFLYSNEFIAVVPSPRRNVINQPNERNNQEIVLPPPPSPLLFVRFIRISSADCLSPKARDTFLHSRDMPLSLSLSLSFFSAPTSLVKLSLPRPFNLHLMHSLSLSRNPRKLPFRSLRSVKFLPAFTFASSRGISGSSLVEVSILSRFSLVPYRFARVSPRKISLARISSIGRIFHHAAHFPSAATQNLISIVHFLSYSFSKAEIESVLQTPVKYRYFQVNIRLRLMKPKRCKYRYDTIKTMLGRQMYFGIIPINKILIHQKRKRRQ